MTFLDSIFKVEQREQFLYRVPCPFRPLPDGTPEWLYLYANDGNHASRIFDTILENEGPFVLHFHKIQVYDELNDRWHDLGWYDEFGNDLCGF